MSTLRRIPWLDRTALVLADVVNHDGSPGRRLAAPGPDRQLRARARRWASRRDRLRARVLPLQGELRRGVGEGLQGPDPDDPLHPRLPHPRDDDGRAVPRRDPPRHARRRHPDRVLQGRGLVRPARGQHPLRGRGHRRRPPHDLQERRQGDRLPERHLGDASWRSRPRRTSAAPATSTRAWSTTTARASSSTARARRPTPSATSSAGCAAHVRELALFVAPVRSTPTSATRPRAGRRPRSPGAATTAPAASGSSATASRGGSSAGSRAPTPTPTSPSRRCSPPGLDGIENETDPGPELKGNAYEAGEAEAFPSSLREAVELWEKSDFAKQAFGESVHKHYLNYGRSSRACSTRS